LGKGRAAVVREGAGFRVEGLRSWGWVLGLGPSLSLVPSRSLSLSHTHTHTLSLSHTPASTHPHTHTLSLTHKQTHTLSLSFSLSHTHSRGRTMVVREGAAARQDLLPRLVLHLQTTWSNQSTVVRGTLAPTHHPSARQRFLSAMCQQLSSVRQHASASPGARPCLVLRLHPPSSQQCEPAI